MIGKVLYFEKNIKWVWNVKMFISDRCKRLCFEYYKLGCGNNEVLWSVDC